MTEKNQIPKHIAIIPDGNRRWAKEKGLIASMGHRKAIEGERLQNLYQTARSAGVKCMTLWGFSTENWKRSTAEKTVLFEIFNTLIDKLSNDLISEKIKFIHIGRKDRLPDKLITKINKLEQETKHFNDFIICLALDYGGRDEIVRATQKMIESKEQISKESIAQYLDTKEMPDVDLIIRTSGEQRLSGFMPYQSTYAELLFVDRYFPDFTVEDLDDAIKNFKVRGRRFGK